MSSSNRYSPEVRKREPCAWYWSTGRHITRSGRQSGRSRRRGQACRAWHEVAAAGLADYHRHHCGYIVSIGFPPSWTGGSKEVGLAPGSEPELKVGMTFHAHLWFTNTEVVDYFISIRCDSPLPSSDTMRGHRPV